MEMKAYLQYVRDESRKHFDAGLTSLEAAKKIAKARGQVLQSRIRPNMALNRSAVIMRF